MTRTKTRPAGAAAAGLSGGLLALALLAGCSHGSASADQPSTKPSTGVKAPAADGGHHRQRPEGAALGVDERLRGDRLRAGRPAGR